MENKKIVEYIETEKLKRYNGAYSPAFFYIDLPVVRYYDKIADSPSVTDLGIFVHEYIHYIQNITTYNGMFWSMVEYKKVSNIIQQIKDAVPDSIDLPMKVNDESVKRLDDRFDFCYRNFQEDTDKIQDSEHWQIRWPSVNVYGKIYKVPHITDLKSGGSFVLSTLHVKESMAFMYQCLIDKDKLYDPLVPNIPYRTIRLLCQKLYPTIAEDTKKLISICFIALQFECPGAAIFGILDFARDNVELDGMQIILHSYLHDKVNYGNKLYDLKTFFHNTIGSFKTELQKTIGNLDFLDRLLTKADEGKDLNAMMSILYTDESGEIDMDDMQMSKDYYEIPYLADIDTSYYPASTTDNTQDATDIIRLLAMYSVYCSLVKPVGQDHVCPFHRECLRKGSDPIMCFEKPWMNNDCYYSRFANEIGLKDKLKSKYTI